MTNQKTEGNLRAEAIKGLLHKFTLCENIIFDCPDVSLQSGRFEEICPLDIKPAIDIDARREKINSLLRVRAKINLRLSLAKRMRQKLKEKIKS